ncbi:hypothetical protein N0V82_004755 [Gnomoniopsis sp. IMI 355080]|nr:hypothetical protein N0V82_004755 [Gnomoniopsis sp. IMI 355080]
MQSGIFSMDQKSTAEPYFIVQRARDLDKLSKDVFAEYSYNLAMTAWPTEPPDVIKWVNGRWPRFEWSSPEMNVVFQYYVNDGVVLQQLLFQNLCEEKLALELYVEGDMEIHDLDILSYCDTPYRLGGYLAPVDPAPEYGFIRLKRFPTEQQHEPQIAASIDIFVDGERQKFTGESKVPLTSLKQGEIREIIAVYRLSVAPSNVEENNWKESMMASTEAAICNFFSEFQKLDQQDGSVKLSSQDPSSTSQTTQPRPQTGIHSTHRENVVADTRQHTDPQTNITQPPHDTLAPMMQKIRYLTARHLEHILFAFQFLIDIERQQRQIHQGKDNDSPRLEDSIRERIQETCEGHMEWLALVWEKSKPKPFTPGCFTANYWVTGEKMSLESDTWQPSDSVTDTAFQVLKMTEFVKTYPDAKPTEFVKSLLTQVFIAWLYDLDRLDYRNQFVWPRPKRDGVESYRLEDHFWVWRALLAMEELDMWSDIPLPKSSTRHSDSWYNNTEAGKLQQTRMEAFKQRIGWYSECEFDGLYNEFYMITRRINPTQVQRSVLQRFATVNDVAGVRMLPVERSSRHTRFLLHDRDSALFYDPAAKVFFQDRSSQSLWEETIKAQPYHPANEKSGSTWFTVMRYALSIMMGAKGQSLNNKKASDALWDSYKTLLHFFNHNGFLGEQLSELAREPVLFDEENDRDSYFHASFEVIYVLFTHAKFLKAKPDKNKDRKKLKRYVRRIEDQMSELLLQVEHLPTALHVRTHLDETGNRQHRLITRPMMERLPFNNHVVSSRVHPIEEEWVYNYPEFLSAPEIEPTLELPSSQSTDKVDNACCENQSAFIADAKKQKQYGELRTRKIQSTDYPRFEEFKGQALSEKLSKARRARDAKKRFIWLSDPNKATRQVYSMASASEVEKQAVTLFFDHHFQHAKDIQDETSLALNVWNSEVHISFLCLMDKAAEDESKDDRESVTFLAPAQFPATPTKVLRRNSMSYRFHGDIFDRYWTCHVVDSSEIPQIKYDSGLEALLSAEIDESVFTDLQKALWQRTVLELVLLMRILENVFQNILSITDALRESLSKNASPAQQGEPKSQLDASALQDQCVDTLDELERDLTSTLETLQKWDDRRKSHGEEKPRWTLKDEDKYRKTIRGVQTALDKKRSEIQKQREDARELQRRFKRESEQRRKDFVDTQKTNKAAKEKERAQHEAEIERKRAARDANSERNIRWFTYVTIVFAPLGFAEGFFSMGGAPSYELIGSLATFSFAALAVTVILLLAGITTFSVLEGRQSAIISEGKEPDQGLWGLLASTILELVARVVLYLMDIWKNRSCAKAIPAFIFAFIVGIPVLFPLFAITWLIKLLTVTISDIYELIKLTQDNQPENLERAGQDLQNGPKMG